MVKVTLKDGAVREFPQGTTVGAVAEALSRKLAQHAVAGKLDGKVVGLATPIEKDVALEIFTFDDPEGREVYRHSSSHLLAQAVQRRFPGTKLGIGPAIENGFYYDFDSEHKFTPEDIEAIEKEMADIIKADYPIERREVSREEAIRFFEERGEQYKVELVRDLPEDAVISMYGQGDFVDLCAGPHLPSTGQIKALKLMSLAGAYWRGSEKNKMLQRIYGTSFPKKAELDEHLRRIEEAKRRDHRRIGQELELYTILEEGPGFPFFFPKGMIVRNELENFWREEHRRAGYHEVRTPIILNRALWERSGHWANYRENMYVTQIDEQDFCIKPMNCPGGMLVYKQSIHSYRDLPLRMGELGLVHRHEISGALHGLMRVRCFTQDDAHIFMTPGQIKEEIIGVIELIDRIYKAFGFEYHVELSTKPEKAMGSDEIWELATRSLEEALTAKGMDFKINPGDGAFYGPKIDFHLKDCIGRTWQCGTIQLDFQMPERFDLTYVGEDGQKHRPVMIHRVVFGSIERFIGILTEHFAGAFPTWLAPVQARVLPITDRHHDYAESVRAALAKEGIRVEVDGRNEKIGYKIREGQVQKIPYLLVVGDKEAENGAIALRKRGEGDKGAMPLDAFKAMLLKEIAEKNNPDMSCDKQ
ncbi:threonine--tRNA ligase [Heliobacterium gestii]|uniref:Threonine--tRNA ligase n=1 Tax=Heliomicrobium gestii TaxID=2699 RepID=A0A845LCX4_HELGE|nr:threonine--tRNA ligase [Heliomicrobium gestii]MZP42489.1 threonine--tRNA ligase [Heliomicrobium gestii]